MASSLRKKTGRWFEKVDMALICIEAGLPLLVSTERNRDAMEGPHSVWMIQKGLEITMLDVGFVMPDLCEGE